VGYAKLLAGLHGENLKSCRSFSAEDNGVVAARPQHILVKIVQDLDGPEWVSRFRMSPFAPENVPVD
jgi:hypothetical protein